ncbi:MAG: hypothetical protein OEX77_11095 [Candidatus Bathyarchaeota archaeon]|nr:hypothetical protein [Candidatus Bathyarchaeota archaeon]MDH5733165.1 hypothetical protein [Candidatus Bathyarchaeota archaeon]
MEQKEEFRVPRYFLLTEGELLSLIVCVLLDISEYVVQILVMPVVGDFFDILGTIACLLMFRWVGIISLIEFIPGADIFPIFIITWMVWYYLKKRRERKSRENQQKKWI